MDTIRADIVSIHSIVKRQFARAEQLRQAIHDARSGIASVLSYVTPTVKTPPVVG